MSFSSHNVVLPDGTQTAPGRIVVASTGVCQAALRYLNETVSPGASVADVGCLEGGYAAEFARAGYDVTGIEARPGNYDSAVWLQNTLGLPNLRFIQGDAWEVLPGMSFDAVFCCGLLYHLDRPAAFLKLLGQATRGMLILNTHFSMLDGHPEAWHQPSASYCDTPTDGHQRNEGRAGHWFHEEDDRWASFSNRSSFWLRKDELLDVLREAGFTHIEERHDWRTDHTMAWGSGGDSADRGMFVALK